MAAILVALSCALAQAPIRIEAEAGRLQGVQAASSIAGFSGKGYVTGWDQEGDRVTLNVNAKAGLYRLAIRYHAAQEKGFQVGVNGHSTTGMFAPTGSGWATKKAGLFELKNGINAITFDKNWGWFEVDWIELKPVRDPPSAQKPPAKTADFYATPKTKALFAYLVKQYGEATLSGQYGAEDNAFIKQHTGKTPAIMGGDFMEYSPSRAERGADAKNETERLIAAAKKGQIVTISWHWNAPTKLLDKMIKDAQGRGVDAKWYKGFYSNATTFDLAAALADRNSQDFKLLLRDIDAIALQLKKLAKAGVPVLWRPLHEADGGWFWWGAKGPLPYKTLWRLMFDRLTNRHKLHNLIWVANVVKIAWYPGDDVVDIVGVDAYPPDVADPLSGTWEELQGYFMGRKLLAITEFGGVPDPERAFRFGARWSYFVSWLGDMGPKKMSPAELKRIYGSKRLVVREELPATKH